MRLRDAVRVRRGTVLLGATVCAVIIGSRGSLSADDLDAMAISRDQARVLAKKSLECLGRAEDSPSDELKLEVHTKGLEYARRAVELDDINPDAHFAVFAHQARLQSMDGMLLNPGSSPK